MENENDFDARQAQNSINTETLCLSKMENCQNGLIQNHKTEEQEKLQNTGDTETKDAPKQVLPKRLRYLRYIKTALLILTWVGFGMKNTMVYTTVPDFRTRLNTTVEGISYAFGIGALGAVAAVPLAALSDRFGGYSDLIIGCGLIVASVTNVIRPFIPKLAVFAVCEFIDELASSTMGCVGHSLVMQMWGKKGKTPMHALSFGYPVGSILGAQIARQFVSVHNENRTINGTSDQILLSAENGTEDMGGGRYLDDSQIEYAFVIYGAYTCMVGILCILVQCCGKTTDLAQISKRSYKWREILQPSRWAQGDGAFGIKILLFSIFFKTGLRGMAKGTDQFLAIYAVDSHLGFNNQEAATLNTAVGLMGALATLLCALVITRYLSIRTMVLVEVHGALILSILLATLATRYKIALYVLACMFPLFEGPLWPSSTAFTDYYIILLSIIVGIQRICVNFFDFGMNSLQGYLYTNVAIESIFYMTVVYAAFMCLLLYLIFFITRNKKSRYKNAEENES